jgi:hypothetical protein
MRTVLSSCLALSLFAAPAFAQAFSFTDFPWTLVGASGAPGSGSGSVTPTLMHVEGSAVGFCTDELVYFETTAPYDGEVKLHLDWTNFDICHYDWPIYVVNGAYTKIPVAGDLSCFLSGAFELTFEVKAGDSFGLGVGSSDCLEGIGVADWTNFSYLPPSWIDLGQGIDPRHEWRAGEPLGEAAFGMEASPLGDLDGDGVSDLVVSGPGFGAPDHTRVLSGSDGDELWSLSGPSFSGRPLADPGDVNADGVPDVLIGISTDSEVSVYSGVDGGLLWAWDWAGSDLDYYGSGLAVFGDRDGDGVDDIAVGSSKLSGRDVILLSGADGSELGGIAPATGDVRFGQALGAPGDVDGDGTGDLLVASINGGASKVALLSGATGLELFAFDPPGTGINGNFSAVLLGGGDLTGDGVPDLLVGAPLDQLTIPNAWSGVVSAHSGVSGGLLWAVEGQHHSSSAGTAVVAGRDVDGDGVGDVAFGAPQWGEPFGTAVGRVDIVSGVDGSSLQRIEGAFDERLGSSLAWIDGQPEPVLAIGIPNQGAEGGEVSSLSDLDHPAGAPRLFGGAALVPGSPWIFRLSHALPNNLSYWVVGISELAAPFKGGVLVPNPDVFFAFPADANGSLVLSDTWPPGVPLPSQLWIQVWMPDVAGPKGWSSTPGLTRQEL